MRSPEDARAILERSRASNMAALKPSDLVVGDEYLTVVCPHCESVIPLGPPMKPLYDPGTQPTLIGCPFCGKSAEHWTDQMEVRLLEVLPPTPG
jgi:hypothetical protein